ncbi:glycosyltransferase [Flagellimonas allohymeniacidonis]|uniref:Glycosyltransferase family 1 protein n=1 Tax=Flagellimonas allohymeniacidonis TaxID=2517819 RepID=A0A4Q8QDH2_9FLAO|nr:glycosyltransferase [Allomuricauda hymeniacidonis]TAI47148.1 glycosyltransferase family 1 protein [Allomuricauda hymeniacidonis]
MIKNQDIVVIGIQAWDIEIGSNCKNIALEFSKNNRVLYVNPPLDRATLRREKNTEKVQKRIRIRNGEENGLVQIEDKLWNLYPESMTESINWIPFHGLFKILNRRNSKVFSRDIQNAMDELGFKDILLFNDSSMFLGLHLKEFLSPKSYTYYMRDYLIKVPYWQRHGERIEPKIIAKADTVVNNSTLYTEYGQQYNPNSFMVGQGCDVSLFNDEKNEIPIPTEFETIPRPILGYVGYLTSMRLDLELLEYLAKERKNWSIVLVGPEDEDFRNSNLHELDNVYFLGSKDASQLPAYVKGFDVAMNPQVVNDWTIGNYPRKIDEYLAMGKPTLATRTKAMEMFEDYVYLGSSKVEYLQLAEKALAEHSKQLAGKRISFAKSHTWENNVLAIYDAIKKSA